MEISDELEYATFHELMAQECQMARVLSDLMGYTPCTLARLLNCSANTVTSLYRGEMKDGHDLKELLIANFRFSSTFISQADTNALVNYKLHKAELIKDERIISWANPELKNAAKNVKNISRDIVNTVMMLASLVAVGQIYKLHEELLIDSIIMPKAKMRSEEKLRNYQKFQEAVAKCKSFKYFLKQEQLVNMWDLGQKYMDRLKYKHKQLAKALAQEAQK